MKTIVGSIVFTAVFGLSAFYNSVAQDSKEYKKTEFGFNIHYLSEAEQNQKALEQIKKDHFSKVRAFEPFTDSLSVKPADAVEKIKFVQKYGFELLLSLSNFKWEPGIVKEQKNISATNKEFIAGAAKYTNRFPPADEAAYKDFLKKFMDMLQQNGCLKSMSFEIGNEPDADRYFWGTENEWQKMVTLIDEVIRPYTNAVSCCGFSSDLVFNDSPGRKAYLDYINSGKFPGNMKFSYHLYLQTASGKAELNNPRTTKVKNGIMTEFGPFSSLNAKNTALMSTPEVMKYLVEMLEFAYTNDVETVYLFPLMDTKKHNTQMGYFDAEGKPKEAYKYLVKLRDVIKSGYTIHRAADYIEVRGKESTLQLSLKTHKIEKMDVSFCACKDEKSAQINEGEWLIYRK